LRFFITFKKGVKKCSQKNTFFLSKKKNTYLTDPTPTGADAIEAFDIEITPARNIKERNQGFGTLGSKASFINSDVVDVKFKTFLSGNGTLNGSTQPIVGKLFDACGFVGTFTTSWDHTFSSTQGSVTIWFFIDGMKYVINGVRGNFSITMTAGEFPIVEWTMKGRMFTQSTISIMTPTTWQSNPKVVQTEDFELGSGTNIDGIETLTIAQSGLQYFKDINNNYGFGRVAITDLDIDVKINPEMTTTLESQFETAILASTTYASHFVHGSGTGEKFTFSFPALQIVDIKYGERNGLRIADVTMKARNAVDGAEDALSITIE